jgi:hypothetical protein
MHWWLLVGLIPRTARRLMELGALSGLLGGVAIAGVGLRPSWQKIGLLIGGLLLVLGFVLIIVAWHWHLG